MILEQLILRETTKSKYEHLCDFHKISKPTEEYIPSLIISSPVLTYSNLLNQTFYNSQFKRITINRKSKDNTHIKKGEHYKSLGILIKKLYDTA